MIRIALRTLRHHKGGFIASFIALFFGATIVVACGGLLETGIHNAAPPQRLAAAPVVVTGEQRYLGTSSEMVFPERVRFDAALAAKIEAVPGVERTAADVSFPASLAPAGGKGPAAQVTGHGWASAALTPYRITQGSAPADTGHVVLDTRLAQRAGLTPGSRVEIRSGGASRTYEVSGLAEGDGEAGGVFLSDAAALAARAAAGLPGTVDNIGVFPASGADTAAVADAVRKAVAGAQVSVLTGDERGRAENPGVIDDGSDLIPLAAAFGGLSAMVTVFVASSTLGLSIQQRQREMALLRAIGTTPGQLRRLILGETVLLAAIATALACIPGPRVGRWLLSAFADAGVVPETIVFRAGSVPLIVGVGTAFVTAVGAAFIAANSAARTRPTEALAEAGLQRRWFSGFRSVLGLFCLIGGAALAVGTAGTDGPDAGSVATPAAMVWTIGFGLLGPVLARGITASLRRPVRALSGLSGHLATRNAKARTARLAAAVMPVMLATGLAVGLIYMQTTQADGADRAFDESLRADAVVTSVSGGMPLETVDAIRGLPGVEAASAQVPSLGFIEPDVPVDPTANGGDGESSAPQPTEVSMQGVTPEGVARTTSFRAASGSLDRLRGDTVALPARYAGDRKIGDTVPMRLGDGTRVDLELVATVDGKRGYETALVPASVLVGHTDAGLVPQIMVSAAPGTDRAALEASLRTLADRQPGLRVTDRQALTAVAADNSDTQSWMAYLVLAVVVGYAAIALVNTQVLATTERRREFMLQRLIGATRRQVMQMMAMEAVLVSVAGIVLGLLVALLTLVPFSMSVLGTTLPTGSPWILVTVVGGALGLTLATTLLSAGAVLRGRPGDLAGIKE
ncbi:FtsX-like permease family protein [Streptomyces sp. NBC_00029]|uniref:FtsX-like permease family protein n=1 Tax=Streptomyces sp. NBC_00029 TaxID=2903613 RepID=UPI003255282A